MIYSYRTVCSNDDLNFTRELVNIVARGERVDGAVAKELYIVKRQAKRTHYHNKTCVLICNRKAVSAVKINKNMVQIVLTKTVFSVFICNNKIIYDRGRAEGKKGSIILLIIIVVVIIIRGWISPVVHVPYIVYYI